MVSSLIQLARVPLPPLSFTLDTLYLQPYAFLPYRIFFSKHLSLCSFLLDRVISPSDRVSSFFLILNILYSHARLIEFILSQFPFEPTLSFSLNISRLFFLLFLFLQISNLRFFLFSLINLFSFALSLHLPVRIRAIDSPFRSLPSDFFQPVCLSPSPTLLHLAVSTRPEARRKLGERFNQPNSKDKCLIGQVVAASKGDDVYSESARIHLRLLLASFYSSSRASSAKHPKSSPFFLTFRLSRRVVRKRINKKKKIISRFL